MSRLSTTEVIDQLRSYRAVLEDAIDDWVPAEADDTAVDISDRALELRAPRVGRRPRSVRLVALAVGAVILVALGVWVVSSGEDETSTVAVSDRWQRLSQLSYADVPTFSATVEYRSGEEAEMFEAGTFEVRYSSATGAVAMLVTETSGSPELRDDPGRAVGWLDGFVFHRGPEGDYTWPAPASGVLPPTFASTIATMCDPGDHADLGEDVVAGRDTAHLTCTNIRGEWEAWVDVSTGLILKSTGGIGFAEEFVGVASFEFVSFDDSPTAVDDTALHADLQAWLAGANEVGADPPVVELLPAFQMTTEHSLAREVVALETDEDQAMDHERVIELRFASPDRWRIDHVEGPDEPSAPGSYTARNGDQSLTYDSDSNQWSVEAADNQSLLDLDALTVVDDAYLETACAPPAPTTYLARAATLYSECEVSEMDPVEVAAAQRLGRPLSASYVIDDATGLVLRTIFPASDHRVVALDFEVAFGSDFPSLDPPDGATEVGTDAPGPLVGQPAPPLPTTLIDGGTFDTASVDGRRHLIVIWASWCPPCLDKLAEAQRLSESDPGYTVVAVDVLDPDPAPALEAMDRGDITIPVLVDPDGTYLEAWDSSGIPVIALVDGDGTVIDHRLGNITPLARLVAEAGW